MLNILVVEDDEKIRETFVGYLTLKGYRVREASNGEQAVSLIGQEAFDVVFMDVRMPKLDGVSACQQIRQTAPATKIVLTTGYQMRQDIEQMVQTGTVECLHKPFTFEELSALLARVVTQP